MPPKASVHLGHILESAALIRGYAAQTIRERYPRELALKDAIECRFVIIGKVLDRLRRDAPDLHARVRSTGGFAALRNLLVHRYDQVDPDVVWRCVHGNLPRLVEDAEALREPASDSSKGAL